MQLNCKNKSQNYFGCIVLLLYICVMITLMLLIMIWYIVSLCKILYNADNFDNLFYGTGLCVGIAIFICSIVYLIIKYLP